MAAGRNAMKKADDTMTVVECGACSHSCTAVAPADHVFVRRVVFLDTIDAVVRSSLET